MKKEFATAAQNYVLDLLKNLPDCQWARVSNKNVLLVDTHCKDDAGEEIFATIDVTIKDTVPTATRDAFDAPSAIAAYAQHEADVAAKKNEKGAGKKESKKNEEYAQRLAGIEDEVRKWAISEMESDKEYTTTEIKMAIPAFENASILELGRVLKRVASENSLFESVKKEGKNLYSKI